MNTKTLLISLNLVFGLTVGLLWLVVGQNHSASAAPVLPKLTPSPLIPSLTKTTAAAAMAIALSRDAIIIANFW